jgi:hypothetical protein
MIFEIMPFNGENTVIKITYETGDALTGEETIAISGLPIASDGASVAEKTEVKTAFKLACKKAVADHIRGRIATLPPKPSTAVSSLVGWKKASVKTNVFLNNYQED